MTESLIPSHNNNGPDGSFCYGADSIRKIDHLPCETARAYARAVSLKESTGQELSPSIRKGAKLESTITLVLERDVAGDSQGDGDVGHRVVQVDEVVRVAPRLDHLLQEGLREMLALQPNGVQKVFNNSRLHLDGNGSSHETSFQSILRCDDTRVCRQYYTSTFNPYCQPTTQIDSH